MTAFAILDSIRRGIVLRTCLAVSVGLSLSPSSVAEDWPFWRGASRNDVSGEDSRWDKQGWPPKEASWEAKVGEGASAPVVGDGKLFTLGWADGADTVVCFDAVSGKRLWEQAYPCPQYGRRSEGDKGLYSGPSASPAYDQDTGLLYTLSTDGDLNCWDTKLNGRRVWNINFYDAFDVPQRPLAGDRRLRDYGYTSSPLIHGDWLIAEVGDDEGALIGFDKRSGKRVWSSASKDPAGHTGGLVPMTVDGIPCVVALTIRNLLVARLDDGHVGETLAEFPWVTDFANSIATPTVSGTSVVITSEYNQYSICRVDVSRDGAKLVWKEPYASGVCSPVIHKGHIYWCWRGVYCLDFETGQPLWRGGIFGDTASCLVTSDDRLIVWADRGELVLAETATRSPKQYTELARRRAIFESDVWPHIVLSDGRLFCKDRNGNIKCFKL
jgi:outer membrane protein assembly factor BamB